MIDGEIDSRTPTYALMLKRIRTAEISMMPIGVRFKKRTRAGVSVIGNIFSLPSTMLIT